ncbi:hypothetical protein OROGR_008403 [Orobanche gracilis]
MEVFDFDHENVIRAEKSKINGFRVKIKKLFRVVEISLVIISLTWASNRLPFAVRVSVDFLRQILNVVVCHFFVFLLGNVIVLTLFLKSPRQHQQDFQDTDEANFCRGFMDSADDLAHLAGEFPPRPPPEEIVYQDKQTILEVAARVKIHRRSQSEYDTCSAAMISSEKKSSPEEDCGDDEGGGRLRRPEAAERPRGEVDVVDELSNEEFQKTIEAFIAKQVEFHQQEKVAIVLHG